MQDEPIIYAPASKKQEMFLNSTAKITIAGGAAGCFDADTEYLTPNGWKKISAYNDELVAQYNLETSEISFVKPTEFIKLPAEKLSRMTARGLDFCLSDEHRVLYYSEGKPSVKTFGEIKQEHTESVQGWDGSIKTTYQLPSKGLDLNEGELKLAIYATDVFSPEWYGVSQAQAEIIVVELHRWQGCSLYHQSFSTKWYCTSDKRNADFMQFIFHACGLNTETVTLDSSETGEVVYLLTVSPKGGGFREFTQDHVKPEIEDYVTTDGYKYCFSVPSTFLLVRRNDKIFISGNSGKALRHGEKVHTPDGWINIEDCKVGQEVTCPVKGVNTILGVYPQGNVEIYRVTFQDGATVDTCGEHLWQYGSARRYGLVGTTRQLQARLKTRSIYVPLTRPIATGSSENLYDFFFHLIDTEGGVVAGLPWFKVPTKQDATACQEQLRSLGYTAKILSHINLEYYVIQVDGEGLRLLYNHPDVKTTCKGNQIVKIEYIGDDLATCIAVSGKHKLFLTTNYIVTHNTYTSLLIALKFMQHPRATGIIFRRTSKMLTSPGSIWHEAVAMYTNIYKTGLKIRHRETEIVFPNGALLKFSHMQHASNMYDHKGGQYSLVIFDEATDFTEEMVMYLVTRMRNAYVDYRPQMFLMTNPDYNSFIRTWIQDYYLDNEGIPIPSRAGHIRYFARQGDKYLWASKRKELEAIYGKGEDAPITSLCFIGAQCDDNPPLLKAQPDYKANLLAQSPIEVKRLYYGSWFARPEASGLWKREWCPTVVHPNMLAKQRVRAYDIAGSLPSSAYPNPDWTRGVLISKDRSSIYTVEDLVSMRDRFQKVEQLIINTALEDGRDCTVVIPCDPNAQAGAWARGMQKRLGEMGFNCRLVKPQQSKATRFAPFSTISQAGIVQIVESDWYTDFCTELENFEEGNRKIKDDIVDAVSDAIFVLNKQQFSMSFSLPDFGTAPQSFGFQSTSIPSNLVTPL